MTTNSEIRQITKAEREEGLPENPSSWWIFLIVATVMLLSMSDVMSDVNQILTNISLLHL